MSLRDRLVPVAATLAVLAVGVVVLLLLRGATTDGIEALEDAKQSQVATTARSFDARVEAALQGVGAYGARPWELTEGSAADQEVLDTFAVDPDARSGSFLVDAQDVITAGVLLPTGAKGSTYDPDGWAAAKRALLTQPAVILPVSERGVTSDLPSYALVVAIPGADPGTLRGEYVIEGALTADSAFSQEIQGLAGEDDSTATWRFVDSQGVVVATSATSGLGEQVTDLDVTTLPEGRSQEGDTMVFVGDSPSAGWRVVYTQDRSEFVAPLVGPLRVAGLVLVALLLLIGLVLVVGLIRRLRQVQEEERRLRELARSQEEFTSVVSHELRTPVAGVLGFLQTTLDHWDAMSEDERATAVRRAFLNARRLQAMTRDVLDSESIESDRFGYTMTELDLSNEVTTAVEGFLGSTPDQVRVELPDGPLDVLGDPDRLQQVLANLLDNARKNAPPDTRIRVTLERDGDNARFAVEDQGGGVDADQVDRIFEKFVRGRDTGVTGTGLGLYISRRIVEAHHGRIWVESAGDRTRFVVELPLVSVPATAGLA